MSTKRPGAWQAAGAAQTAEGQWTNTWSLGSTNAQLFVQFGMVGKYVTSASEAFASLQGGVSNNSASALTRSGRVLLMRTGHP